MPDSVSIRQTFEVSDSKPALIPVLRADGAWERRRPIGLSSTRMRCAQVALTWWQSGAAIRRSAWSGTSATCTPTAASEVSLHDNHSGIALLRVSRRPWPFLAHCRADRAYRGERVASAAPGAIGAVGAAESQTGFAVHPRRWVIERVSASHPLGDQRGLALDHGAVVLQWQVVVRLVAQRPVEEDGQAASTRPILYEDHLVHAVARRAIERVDEHAIELTVDHIA